MTDWGAPTEREWGLPTARERIGALVMRPSASVDEVLAIVTAEHDGRQTTVGDDLLELRDEYARGLADAEAAVRELIQHTKFHDTASALKRGADAIAKLPR